MKLFNTIRTNLLLIGSLLAVGTTSCVMDNFDDDTLSGRKPYTGEKLAPGKYRVAFDIGQVGLTRSIPGDGQIVDGDHGEHDIGAAGNFALFLDESGEILSVNELFGTHKEHPEDYIEGRYISDIIVDPDSLKVPKKCVVLLNALPFKNSIKESKGENISGIFGARWFQHYDADGIETDTVGRNDNGRFLMANSIRFDLDTLGNVFLNDAQPVPREVIQDALVDSIDSTRVITVKVERMVAKATLAYQDKDGSIVPLDFDHVFGPDVEFVNMFTGFDKQGMHQFKVVKYRVRCTGWGMNALEKEGSLFKNLGEGASYSDQWNDPRRYRYHWAEDAHYRENAPGGKENLPAPYPWQYRDAINRSHIDHYSSRGMGNTLKNYSYDDFVRMNYFEKEIYFPENTFDKEALDPELDNQANIYAGTHFIMTAILETAFDAKDPEKATDEDFTKWTPDERTIYRDRIGNIYREQADAYKSLIVSFNYALQSQPEMKYPWYDWDGHGDGDDTWVAASGSKYALYYKIKDEGPLNEQYLKITVPNLEGEYAHLINTTLVEANIRKGDGQRMILDKNFMILDTLQLKNNVYDPMKIYKVTDWEYVKNYNRNIGKGQTPLDIDDYLESQGRLETDRHFATTNDVLSIMFDWIGPIDHFNQGKMYYFHPIELEKGTYGVVRNNWYQFVLTGIHHLGTSVDNPSDPIVPNAVDENDQAIDIKGRILDWHRVDQSVPWK